MKALYWPTDEYDCTAKTRRIEHTSMIHEHFTDEQAACRAFVRHRDAFPDLWNAGRRHRCIRGPRGLLRGVTNA